MAGKRNYRAEYLARSIRTTLRDWGIVDTGFGQTCSVEDCSRNYYIRGLCKYHHDLKTYQEERSHAPTPSSVQR